MNDPPKYDSYNLEELYSMASYIDQETHPERYALLMQEIQKQEKYRNENPVSSQTPKKSQSGCSLGFGLGVWAGLGAGIWWGQVYVPTGPISGDCIGRTFGLLGLAVAGVLGGGFFGALIGACFNRK